ncbi:ribonuclease Z [Peribacillus alkalitolerans]|uniref:ribonuclease Z n=1 Tax=Peribacillus alkalitolerans TaxID=1550385 RepID=UPI0013D0890B|nr:ribonuclease Z [Peribacillus alkalitolerans]
MDIVFLGTGAGVPAKKRNVSSLALQLLEERRAVWLFDCGEATQHQILHTSVKPRRIEKIFITHLHGDHIFGLPGLLGSRSFQGGTEPLVIHGPKGIADFVWTSLKVSGTHLKYALSIVENEEGVIFEDDLFKVETKLLEHGLPSWGYRVIEKDRPGELKANDLMSLGIRPGPIFKNLKNGETVILEDGRTIDGTEFLNPPKKGKIVTILGDSRYCRASVELSLDADVLVHEATFAKVEEEMAYSYYHSTTSQAASVAKEANVSKLILNHISSRYVGKDVETLLAEAKETFDDVIVAEDLLKIEL